MPIQAKQILNPLGSITVDVVTLGDNGQPQEEPLTFTHKIITAGAWAKRRYELDEPDEKPDKDLTPEEVAAQKKAEEEKAAAEREALAFLMTVPPDDLSDEQLKMVLKKLPIVEEVLDFLVGWDVVDGEVPLPVTARNLLKMDPKLLRQMSHEHHRATFPNWTT